MAKPVKKTEKALIYSVKLEGNGATKIITLRISNNFTELSLEKNGKLAEIMCEQNGEITHQTFK